MMNRHVNAVSVAITLLFVLACAATAFAAQTFPPSKDKTATAPHVAKALTLIGCVVKGEAEDPLTLADPKNGAYHLSGTDLRPYLGSRVPVTGIRIGGLHLVGGLSPSPNVAAQAGAIDSARAAVAAMPGGASHGIGPEPMLEFQVKEAQALRGVCP
jgi:hypothetical protein